MSALKELVTNVEAQEEKRAKALKDLEEIRAALQTDDGERDLTEQETTRSDELLAEIETADKELRELDKRLKEENRKAKRLDQMQEARKHLQPAGDGVEGHLSSVNEPMVYGPESENSYVNDFVRWYGGPSWAGHESAGKRLAEWQHQVEREIARNEKSTSSQAALAVVREKLRESYGDRPVEAALREVRERGRTALEDKPELRAIGTDGGASATAPGEGSAFVTPVFFVSDYAPYRETGRAFADQCNKQPLPPYGRHDALATAA